MIPLTFVLLQGVGVAYPRLRYDLDMVDIAKISHTKSWPQKAPTSGALAQVTDLLAYASKTLSLVMKLASAPLAIALSPLRYTSPGVIPFPVLFVDLFLS